MSKATFLRFICAVALIGTGSFVGVTAPARSYDGENLAKSAKLTEADARAIALKARPGEITDEELEKERGGSGLRYSFDVKSDGKTYEVGVDAETGAVLENAPEGKNPD